MPAFSAMVSLAAPLLRAAQAHPPITCRQVTALGTIAPTGGRTARVYAGRAFVASLAGG